MSSPLKLCSLPPTAEAFNLHVLHARYQCILWHHSMLSYPINLDPCNVSFPQFPVITRHHFNIYITSIQRHMDAETGLCVYWVTPTIL